MPVITFDLPDEREEDLLRRFAVNRHYLTSFRNYLVTTFGADAGLYDGLRSTVQAHGPFAKVRGGGARDNEAVRRWMRLAWTSEIQLHLPGILGVTSVLGFSNTWAPVHAYYSVYGALQAWFAANGMTGVADDHAATLRSIATMNQQRQLLPAPWGVLCIGCPMRKERHYLNAPVGAALADRIEVLAVPDAADGAGDFWPRYGTWLRSTREARLEAREADWKRKKNRRNISPAARTQIAGSLAPTSVFDCFWRMRIRSNYGSVDQFLALHVDERDHLAYFRAICSVTRATLALLELYAARKIGQVAFADLVTDFLAGDENNIADKTLRARAQQLGWL